MDCMYTNDLVNMLKYLLIKNKIYPLSHKLGISKSSLYYYLNGKRKVKDKSIYNAILIEYYKARTKIPTKRLFNTIKKDRKDEFR